jgi:RNA polymerase sigma factor (sigma-70 family)
VGASDAHRAIEAVWRIEAPRLVAGLVRIVRDLALAEELAQDALVAALERWPGSGVPDKPGAWLMATAKHRAIDHLRRCRRRARRHEERAREAEREQAAAAEPDLDDEIGDELLGLMFVACHPILSTEARVALTLRLLGGLTTEEIARAFLVPEPTVAQRIVRAKRTLAEAGTPFEVPRGAERAARLSSVLEVVYLIFNEGYTSTGGDGWTRPALCEEALRLGRVLAGLVPDEAEVHGLVALMEIQASRSAASRKPARSSPARRRSRATPASASCCSGARRLARADRHRPGHAETDRRGVFDAAQPGRGAAACGAAGPTVSRTNQSCRSGCWSRAKPMLGPTLPARQLA